MHCFYAPSLLRNQYLPQRQIKLFTLNFIAGGGVATIIWYDLQQVWYLKKNVLFIALSESVSSYWSLQARTEFIQIKNQK